MTSRASGESAALVGARATIDKHKAAEAALSDRIRIMLSKRRELQAQLDGLRQKREDRNLAAALAGEAIPDEDAGEAKTIRRLESEVRSLDAAVPVLQQEQRAASEAMVGLQRELAEEFVRWKSVKFQDALNEAREALTALRGPLAKLLALEVVQKQLLGPAFTVSLRSNTPEAWQALSSAEPLVDRFLKAMPPRLRPHRLSTDQLQTAVVSAAASLNAEIQQ